MASTRDFLEFVLEQLSDLPDIDYRAMMGEFVIYYRGKVVAGIYDNRFLVKNTESAKKCSIKYPTQWTAWKKHTDNLKGFLVDFALRSDFYLQFGAVNLCIPDNISKLNPYYIIINRK